jgi:hypothetical protein
MNHGQSEGETFSPCKPSSPCIPEKRQTRPFAIPTHASELQAESGKRVALSLARWYSYSSDGK